MIQTNENTILCVLSNPGRAQPGHNDGESGGGCVLPAHPHCLQEGDERLVRLPPHFCQLHVELDDFTPTPGLEVHKREELFSVSPIDALQEKQMWGLMLTHTTIYVSGANDRRVNASDFLIGILLKRG